MTEQNNPKPNTITPPSSGPAYKPIRKSTEEAVQDLLDANIMLMNVIDQLHERIKKVEAELRQAHGKISKLEQLTSVHTKCINEQADVLDKIKEEL